MEQDKRRFTRISLPFPIIFSLENGESQVVQQIKNLSVGGCLLTLARVPETGRACTVIINLSNAGEDGPCIRAQGTVVRRIDEDIAIQFTAIDPESLFHLQHLLLYNAPDPDKIDSEIQLHPGIL